MPGPTPKNDSSPPKGETPPKPRPTDRPARRDGMAKVEERLTEMFGAVALGQMGLALATDDPRHGLAAQVTSDLSPALVSAWVQLGRENVAVGRVLERMSQSTAWGEVTIMTLGMAYSQAQAYGAVPPSAPNPWTTVTPVSEEVTGENDASRWAGRDRPPEGTAEGTSAHEQAERDRVEAERKRKNMPI